MWIVSRRDNLCLAGVLSEAKPTGEGARRRVSRQGINEQRVKESIIYTAFAIIPRIAVETVTVAIPDYPDKGFAINVINSIEPFLEIVV